MEMQTHLDIVILEYLQQIIRGCGLIETGGGIGNDTPTDDGSIDDYDSNLFIYYLDHNRETARIDGFHQKAVDEFKSGVREYIEHLILPDYVKYGDRYYSVISTRNNTPGIFSKEMLERFGLGDMVFKSVRLSKYMLRVGRNTFNHPGGSMTVELPNRLQEIRENAFYDAIEQERLVIPESVRVVESGFIDEDNNHPSSWKIKEVEIKGVYTRLHPLSFYVNQMRNPYIFERGNQGVWKLFEDEGWRKIV